MSFTTTSSLQASSSNFALKMRFQLLQEIESERKNNPKPDYSKLFVLFVTPYALNYAIVCRITYLFDLALFLNQESPQLNQPFGARNFTPLHVAVISNNFEVAQKLLEARVSPNSCDTSYWTPLHYAALLSNHKMMQLLIAYDAKKNMRTNRGATCEDIWNLIHLPSSNSSKIRLIWQEEGRRRTLTRGEFQKLTSAEFIEENHTTPDQLWVEWSDFTSLRDEFPFTAEFAQKYDKCSEFPIHVLSRVTKDAQGNPLLKSPGMGLFAACPMERGQIIGEYRGIIGEHSLSDPFLLEKTSALTYRNEIPLINDGFINVVQVPIFDKRGLSKRYLFITANTILEGEQFCCSYGFPGCKLGPYVELRPQETREFIKGANLEELIRCLMISITSKKCSFEEFVLAEKFRYILETPALLYAMILDGTLSTLEAKNLFAISYRMNCIDQNAPKGLNKLVEIATDSYKIHQRLLKVFPKMASAYDQYFKALLAKEGIILTLYLAEKTNKFMMSRLSIVEADLMQLNKREKERADLFLLNIWNEELIPNNEMTMYLFKKIQPST